MCELKQIEREKEKEQLKSWLDSEQSACIIVEGLPGVGKSTFLETDAEELKIKEEHFGIYWKILRSEKFSEVMAELINELRNKINEFSHWKVDKEKVVAITEYALTWLKSILKIPEDVPFEKIASYVAGRNTESSEENIVHYFVEMLNKLTDYIPDRKKLVIMIDQAERVTNLNMLYDIIDILPKKSIFIIAIRKSIIIDPDIRSEVNILKIENFSFEETKELLKENSINKDINWTKEFYEKFKGHPKLQGMAICDIKSSPNNYNLDKLDKLPETKNYLDNLLLYIREIKEQELKKFVWNISVFRNSLSKKYVEIDEFLLKNEKFSRIIKTNKYFEIFPPIFREYIYKYIEENLSNDELRKFHDSAFRYYYSVLCDCINDDETVEEVRNELRYHKDCAERVGGNFALLEPRVLSL
jgi:hypothetical protein